MSDTVTVTMKRQDAEQERERLDEELQKAKLVVEVMPSNRVELYEESVRRMQRKVDAYDEALE